MDNEFYDELNNLPKYVKTPAQAMHHDITSRMNEELAALKKKKDANEIDEAQYNEKSIDVKQKYENERQTAMYNQEQQQGIKPAVATTKSNISKQKEVKDNTDRVSEMQKHKNSVEASKKHYNDGIAKINQDLNSGTLSKEEYDRKKSAWDQYAKNAGFVMGPTVDTSGWQEFKEGAKDFGSRVQKAYNNPNASTPNIPQSLYSGLNSIGSYFANRAAKDPVSKNLQNAATLEDKRAAQIKASAQKEHQIANRDYRVEADKNAASTAASQNAQNISNLSASAGGATAALNRKVATPDYDTQMRRQDELRGKANILDNDKINSNLQAEAYRSGADQLNEVERQRRIQNSAIDKLTTGTVGEVGKTPNEAPVVVKEPEPEVVEQPAPTEPVNTVVDENTTKEEAISTLAILQNAINARDKTVLKRYNIDGSVSKDPTTWRSDAKNAGLVQKVDSLTDVPYNDLEDKLNQYRDDVAARFGKGTNEEGRYDVSELIQLLLSQDDVEQPPELSDSRVKNIIKTLSNYRF